MKTFRTSLAILFAAILLAFPGRLSATKHIVSVGNFFFSPATLTVSVGDTIRWVWSAGTHTTTSVSGGIPAGAASWNAPITSSSNSFEYRVTMPGAYSYVCTPHAPGMAGSFNATTVGISPNMLTGLRIGPNPTTGTVRVTGLGTTETTVEATVYNGAGKLVKSESLSGKDGNTIDLQDLQAGSYYIKLTAGELSETRQILVVR